MAIGTEKGFSVQRVVRPQPIVLPKREAPSD
jgi:hypothetical protein